MTRTDTSQRPLPAEGADATEVAAPVTVAADPHRPGPDRARLVDAGVPVWAVIGYLLGLDDEITPAAISRTAAAYAIPEAAVRAAVAYYAEHRAAIDTRLAINTAATA